jgi:hypothetical protein
MSSRSFSNRLTGTSGPIDIGQSGNASGPRSASSCASASASFGGSQLNG